MSKIGKSFPQNWKRDPMNSPKAFGELKIIMSGLINQINQLINHS